MIPVYSFGENDLYHPVVDNREGSLARRFQDRLTSMFGYTVPLVAGRKDGLGVVPYRTPLLTVIGKPIHVPHVPSPTLEQILEVSDTTIAYFLSSYVCMLYYTLIHVLTLTLAYLSIHSFCIIL